MVGEGTGSLTRGMSSRAVHLHSSCGIFVVELYENSCADSFWALARSGQLSQLRLKYLLPGFVLVGEVEEAFGLSCSAAAAADLQSFRVKTELRHVGAGLLTCKPSFGEVAGSRFYITLSPQPHLDDSHVVFGRIYSGMQVIDKISNLQVDAQFYLYSPVEVLRCTTSVLPKAFSPAPVTEADSSKYEVLTLSASSLLRQLE